MPRFPRKLSLKQRLSHFQFTRELHRTRERGKENEAVRKENNPKHIDETVIIKCGWLFCPSWRAIHPPRSVINCPYSSLIKVLPHRSHMQGAEQRSLEMGSKR